jgi:hypothetical protein
MINALVWSFLTLITTINSKSVTQLSAHQVIDRESFCRDDYLIVGPGNNSFLSFADSSASLTTSKKVTRHELVRMEGHDLQNQQWVIRTWDNGHLATDNNGNIIVQVHIMVLINLIVVA